MSRPYVICHMVTSINGGVTGEFLGLDSAGQAIEKYYEINRAYNADGYALGRITMEESFTHGRIPELEGFSADEDTSDYVLKSENGFYAIAFDPHGRLGWNENKIIDEDEGYTNAKVIEVLTESVDPRYIAYLKAKNISYIFAGREAIDVSLALEKLYGLFGIKKLLLEGGSIINGSFAMADVIDEISIVIAPVVSPTKAKPLFSESILSEYTLNDVERYSSGAIRLVYKK